MMKLRIEVRRFSQGPTPIEGKTKGTTTRGCHSRVSMSIFTSRARVCICLDTWKVRACARVKINPGFSWIKTHNSRETLTTVRATRTAWNISRINAHYNIQLVTKSHLHCKECGIPWITILLLHLPLYGKNLQY